MNHKTKTTVVTLLIIVCLVADVNAVLSWLWKTRVTVRIDPLTPRSSNLEVLCEPSGIVRGETTTITGNLFNATSKTGISDSNIDLFYMTSSMLSWVEIAAVNTLSNGLFDFEWADASKLSSGSYVVNATYSGSVDFDPWTAVTDLQIHEAPSTYGVTFKESGLPSGDTWNVTLNGVTSNSTSDTTITFRVPIGSYPFEIKSTVPTGSLLLSPIPEDTSGIVKVYGDTTVEIEWLPSAQCYDFKITEIGLPQDTSWTATYGCVSQTASSPNDIVFWFPTGTYYFSANSLGYTAEPLSFGATAESATSLEIRTTVMFVPDSNPREAASWDPLKDSYNLTNPPTVWSMGGNCYGLSSTAILYFMHYNLDQNDYPYFPSQNPDATSTSDLDLGGNSALNNASLAVMLHQRYGHTPIPTVSVVDMNKEYSNLVGNLTEGHPVLLSLGNSTDYYHAVVAWGCGTLQNGSCAIAFYDPDISQSTQVAIFDSPTDYFSYVIDTYKFDRFAVSNPSTISLSWDYSEWKWPGWPWINFPVYNNYYIVIADKNVTVEVNGLKDTFSEMGNSEAFVKGIMDSSGIEEGNTQAYSISGGIKPGVYDPSSNQSKIIISHIINESGQTIEYDYFLNASTTQGYLNFTVTPTDSGLSITTGNNALNASFACYSATQQGYSVSDVLTAQIDSGQSVNLTAPCLARFTASKTVAGKRYAIPVNVTITNAGSNPENVSITLYANGTALDSEMVYNLMNGTAVDLVCLGNTSSCTYGNYRLNVYCQPNGINEAANNFTGGWIVVAGIGDLTGGTPNAWDFVPDGKVDIVDVAVVAKFFSQKVPPAPANCDVSGSTIGVPDGRIDITDVATVAKQYGNHYTYP